MKPPLTNEQEVLFTLITQGFVSSFDYPVMFGFRTRLSSLKLDRGVKLETKMIKAKNKHGRTYLYALHKLIDKESAKKLYDRLTVNN